MRFFSNASGAFTLTALLVHHVYGLAGQDLPTTTTTTTATGIGGHPTLMDRRSMWKGLATTATAAAVTLGWMTRHSVVANAATMGPSSIMSSADVAPGELHGVYFGVGCHEFVQAERDRLGRKDNELTSMAGYAGGTKTGENGKVCYHNRFREADYGALGHGEVVGVTIPVEEIVPFTEFYFSLYNPKTKDRVDPQDRGAEYRSLVGIPGGAEHPMYPKMQTVAERAGYTMIPGKGDDPDTLGKQIVYVYDTNRFPFYQAEVYHQFHNDFQSPAYGSKYNNLADEALEDGRIHITGCPDRV